MEHISTNLCCYISLQSQHSTDLRSASTIFVSRGVLYGHQCHNCKKYNHWKSQCRSKKQVNVVEEDSDGSGESLLSIQVIRNNKKLITTIRASVNDSHKLTRFQIDTGASCNILNHKDFVDLGKPKLDNHKTELKQSDGSITRALGGCELEVA